MECSIGGKRRNTIRRSRIQAVTHDDGLRSALLGWDRGADRASNDADVSSILPIIPYGGFSPVRLEGWHIRRDLPETSISLSLLPACADRRRFVFALRAPRGHYGSPALCRAADSIIHCRGG